MKTRREGFAAFADFEQSVFDAMEEWPDFRDDPTYGAFLIVLIRNIIAEFGVDALFRFSENAIEREAEKHSDDN